MEKPPLFIPSQRAQFLIITKMIQNPRHSPWTSCWWATICEQQNPLAIWHSLYQKERKTKPNHWTLEKVLWVLFLQQARTSPLALVTLSFRFCLKPCSPNHYRNCWKLIHKGINSANEQTHQWLIPASLHNQSSGQILLLRSISVCYFDNGTSNSISIYLLIQLN